MDIDDDEYFQPFIIRTYRSFFNVSLSKVLLIWSITGIIFNLLFFLFLIHRKRLIFSIYSNNSVIFNIYICTMLSSFLFSLLTTFTNSRRLAITCLVLTSFYLIATLFMIGRVNAIFVDESSFGNKCLFGMEYFFDWEKPFISQCNENNKRICISNDDFLSTYLIDNCSMLILGNKNNCDKFQDELISKKIISGFVKICTDSDSLRNDIKYILTVIYSHIIFMLLTIPVGLCVLRVIYSIYCIITVGGTGWEHKSAEEIFFSPKYYYSNKNLIIPCRYSLNGKNYLRV
ncbi:hypothetical protein FG386_002959 [Cryptosporidium ryanae]|uniref:uncharacterized protein n=1 Tax=Cryptosporidium ryanae TaxID=515981 RepID=UPI00351A9EC2|nr:hypothetical protein FG386_002959 [Cryptosporidium ryanae]